MENIKESNLSSTFEKTNMVSDSHECMNPLYVEHKANRERVLEWLNDFTENKYRLRVTPDNIIWRYEDGMYKPDGERFVMGLLNITLKSDINEQFRREIIANIKYDINRWIDYKEFDEHLELINLANGIYNWNTNEFIEHTPDILFAHKLPIEYVPNAKPQKFLKFLNEVIEKEDVPIIQELAGYLFYKQYTFHRAFMFVGDGGNGKSTLIHVLRNIIGDENTTSVSLKSIGDSLFSLSNLHQKLANMCADLTAEQLNQTGNFKILTGQDMINAPRKYLPDLEFVNYAKLVFSCNQIPYAKDDSDSYFQRWIIINFPHKFRGTERDNKHLKEELTTKEELSGVFNWGMEGLRRLLENKKFSYSKTTKDTKMAYVRNSSSVKAFIDEMLVETLNQEITKNTVWESYKIWCRDTDLPVGTKHNLTNKIKESFTYVDDSRKHGGELIWRNLEIRQFST